MGRDRGRRWKENIRVQLKYAGSLRKKFSVGKKKQKTKDKRRGKGETSINVEFATHRGGGQVGGWGLVPDRTSQKTRKT